MKNRKEIGLDQWIIHDSLIYVLHNARHRDLELYDVQEYTSYIMCFAPIYQRNKMHHVFEHGELVKTTGVLGYVVRSLKRPARVIGTVVAIVLWIGMSQMIYDIEIKGIDKEGRQLIEQTLKDMKVEPPFYDKDMLQLKQTIKKKLEHKIAWLEIEKIGSKYRISYTPKEFAILEKPGHEELIARQDGLIQRYEVLHGNKLHKVNTFVHKGDVLVSNVLDTSDNKKQELYVKGRVFAYTWKDVTVEMKDDHMPKSMQYFDMLLEGRSEISNQMKKDDKIYKENILQFSKELGKIKMVIHYTLIQDITTP